LLHAEQLKFDHPLTGEPIHVVTQAPESVLRR
jgi:23S rRNA-/tRNA-specific pseudouridylate synthase